ncbi:MAG TPA: FAD-dependent oxidoreductase [Oligoflexus sp.]|uniref:FAD-dependent oxidoreductase n=1 Tax=Oligoflexus sp. TaxID=1971216 RepID=UPI002D68B507|nr:FAD-dependent oxidoreductase [Oligoflexus sp.]HYX32441.1 FAD-dependent oxidoreductase [Oligoflexus sp.]
MSLVVIGNGNVSFWFLKKLGERGFLNKNKVVVFAEESVAAYDRINLSQLFDGTTLASILFAQPQQYQEAGIALHLDDPIVEVDTKKSTVRSRSGRTVDYDQLVFATGSSAFVPSMEGVEHADNVYSYRTSKDVEAILQKAKESKSACIVGGGFLGVELAEALHNLGLTTHIIEMNPGLFPRQLDHACGQKVASVLEKKGVYVHLMRRSKRVRHENQKVILEFVDQESLSVDMLIFAVGIRPRDELAKAAGIKTGPLGGIAINPYLQTSDPKVYAIGDCAYFANKIYGLVSPGYQMAEVLASCLVGQRRMFPELPLAFSQSCFGIRIASFGQQAAGKSLVFEKDIDGQIVYRRINVHGQRMLGAYALGDWPEISKVQRSVERKALITPGQRLRFLKTGNLWPTPESLDVTTWPDTAIVCNCLSLSKGYLCNVAQKSQLSADQLVTQTRASTICGQCRPLVERLATHTPYGPTPATPFATSPSRIYRLEILCYLTLIGVGWFLFRHPLKIPRSYTQSGPELLTWLQNPLYQQATGYAVAGWSLLTLVLSIRKRTGVFSYGKSLTNWYTLHALMGLLGLGALVFHTGRNIGSHMNAALAIAFLGLTVSGALTGLSIAYASRVGFLLGRRLRTLLVWIHIIIFWMYPTLLAFHIFSSYYYR